MDFNGEYATRVNALLPSIEKEFPVTGLRFEFKRRGVIAVESVVQE